MRPKSTSGTLGEDRVADQLREPRERSRGHGTAQRVEVSGQPPGVRCEEQDPRGRRPPDPRRGRGSRDRPGSPPPCGNPPTSRLSGSCGRGRTIRQAPDRLAAQPHLAQVRASAGDGRQQDEAVHRRLLRGQRREGRRPGAGRRGRSPSPRPYRAGSRMARRTAATHPAEPRLGGIGRVALSRIVEAQRRAAGSGDPTGQDPPGAVRRHLLEPDARRTGPRRAGRRPGGTIRTGRRRSPGPARTAAPDGPVPDRASSIMTELHDLVAVERRGRMPRGSRSPPGTASGRVVPGARWKLIVAGPALRVAAPARRGRGGSRRRAVPDRSTVVTGSTRRPTDSARDSGGCRESGSSRRRRVAVRVGQSRMRDVVDPRAEAVAVGGIEEAAEQVSRDDRVRPQRRGQRPRRARPAPRPCRSASRRSARSEASRDAAVSLCTWRCSPSRPSSEMATCTGRKARFRAYHADFGRCGPVDDAPAGARSEVAQEPDEAAGRRRARAAPLGERRLHHLGHGRAAEFEVALRVVARAGRRDRARRAGRHSGRAPARSPSRRRGRAGCRAAQSGSRGPSACPRVAGSGRLAKARHSLAKPTSARRASSRGRR